MKLTHLVAMTAFALGTAAAAHADTLNGTLNIAGIANINTTPGTVVFTNPAQILGEPIYAGVTTGDFTQFGQTYINMSNIDYAHFSSPEVLFTDTVGANTLEFELTSLTAAVANGSSLYGNGIFTMNGEDATKADFQLTTQTNSAQNVTFSATAATTPEPESLALFGTGLLGLVGIARRKFSV